MENGHDGGDELGEVAQEVDVSGAVAATDGDGRHSHPPPRNVHIARDHGVTRRGTRLYGAHHVRACHRVLVQARRHVGSVSQGVEELELRVGRPPRLSHETRCWCDAEALVESVLEVQVQAVQAVGVKVEEVVATAEVEEVVRGDEL